MFRKIIPPYHMIATNKVYHYPHNNVDDTNYGGLILIKKKLSYLFIITLIIFSSFIIGSLRAKADTSDRATLRIMATSDLHGQVTAYDYETNLALPSKGLSKVATLIKQKRAEVGSDNSLLVDAGDFLYDYTTNYFYDNYKSNVQPILNAMYSMGYDYITLGNHEFDYPWDYLHHQLDDSNMLDKVLVCNTVWHDTGELVFAPSAITTKKLTTANGRIAEVKIGIIGSTTNSISTRRGDYVNEIDALNNYDSIVAEANRLKKVEKVDVVLVLLHGGIGSGKSYGESDNIGYALTKVDSIDAIVTGHTHVIFPDANNPGITSSGTDLSNGLINGKPVVATSCYARAFGIIDLNFFIGTDGTVKLSTSKASINYVTGNIKEDSQVTSIFKSYQSKLKAALDTTTYPITKGITYHNYDTVVQDSNLYQLLNNAKIAYGLTYVSQYLPAYKNVPIIACTRNLLDSNEAYVLLKDNLSSSKVTQLLSESSSSRPSGYTQLYELSGKNLKEWLEYNASIYATEGTNFKKLLQRYVSINNNVSTLLQEGNVYNWNTQYVFDGVSYSVDLTKKARYTAGGTLLSANNRRITNLTYNGITVTDTMKFVIVADSGIPSLSFLPADIEGSIKGIKDYATGKNITLDYIKRLSSFGSIFVKADHNWSLFASTNYSFLLGIPKKILTTEVAFSWNKGIAAETTSYSFLKGTLPTASQLINIVVAQGRTEINNTPVPVLISASSKNSLKEIKYLSGIIKTKTDTRWKNAETVKNNQFLSNNNGNYTILVTDSKNKSSLAYITVDRYDTNILPSPKLDRLTNRNSTFTGTAVPNSILHATIDGTTYTTTVTNSGTFRIDVIPPKAFSPISVYVEAAGIKSAVVTAAVRKTGPDAVQIDPVSVGDTSVTGTTNPDTLVYALIWTTIYVGKGQADAYKSSDFYNSKYKIVETDITIDKISGKYVIQLPSIKYNMKVFVFCFDRFGTTSKSIMRIPVNRQW